MNEQAPWNKEDSTDRCAICGTVFDNYVHRNCGGDCLECMVLVGGDPDLMPQLKLLWQADALEKMRDALSSKCTPDAIAEINAEIQRLRLGNHEAIDITNH